MNPSNKVILDDYRRFHDTLTKAGYLMGLSGRERSEMVRIIREEWMPGYATDLWCAPCVANMVLLCYRYYDEYLAKEAAKTTVESTAYSSDSPLIINPDPAPIPEGTAEFVEFKEDGEIVKTVEPFAPLVPIKTKVTFPSHKKNHHR